MRLTLALGSLLAIVFCSPIYVSTTTSDEGVVASDSSISDSPFPMLEMVDKAKPTTKGKPLPPKPDALPTYELVAAVHGLSGALLIDLLR